MFIATFEYLVALTRRTSPHFPQNNMCVSQLTVLSFNEEVPNEDQIGASNYDTVARNK